VSSSCATNRRYRVAGPRWRLGGRARPHPHPHQSRCRTPRVPRRTDPSPGVARPRPTAHTRRRNGCRPAHPPAEMYGLGGHQARQDPAGHSRTPASGRARLGWSNREPSKNRRRADKSLEILPFFAASVEPGHTQYPRRCRRFVWKEERQMTNLINVVAGKRSSKTCGGGSSFDPAPSG
jgi:hypothetical protein